ncbi:hypothetical protein B0H10DRAFT_820760 [Mycena sp. CBHHK59/15]|nr:hypothetical protein B0H10DRAFT_820760 [Mycena sp. CBHHK59/15]
MQRSGINYLVAAALGVGITVYTFLPLIQSRELERATKTAENALPKSSQPNTMIPKNITTRPGEGTQGQSDSRPDDTGPQK